MPRSQSNGEEPRNGLAGLPPVPIPASETEPPDPLNPLLVPDVLPGRPVRVRRTRLTNDGKQPRRSGEMISLAKEKIKGDQHE